MMPSVAGIKRDLSKLAYKAPESGLAGLAIRVPDGTGVLSTSEGALGKDDEWELEWIVVVVVCGGGGGSRTVVVDVEDGYVTVNVAGGPG